MEWQQILGFYHVARLESFTKAGEVTLRTQSALSQQVKSLEEQLGCQLFERIGTRKVKLTPAGMRFMQFAEAVLGGYEVLKEELADLQAVQKGALKIAAPFTTLYHLFPKKLKEYLELFPQVELTLLDRPQRKVAELVRSGEVDFGLALESVAARDLSVLRWKQVETVLMTPLGHPLAKEERVTLEQIAQYPLILPPKSFKCAGRMLLERHLRPQGIDIRIVMESSNVELSAVYVEMGLGVSFATVVKDLPALTQRKLAFIGLPHYFQPDYLAVIARKNRQLPAYQQAFLNSLLEIL